MQHHSINKKDLGQIVHAWFRKLTDQYEGIRQNMDKEAIHSFRVEVKKLRAFLQMLTWHGSKKIKLPGKLKEVYHSAGIVRDFQLHQVIGETNSNATKEFRVLLRDSLLNRAEKAIRHSLPAHLSGNHAFKYLTSQRRKLKRLLGHENITDTELHTIRKYLKNILYNAKTIAAHYPGMLPVGWWNEDEELFLNSMAHRLGEFHDGYCIDPQISADSRIIPLIPAADQKNKGKNMLVHDLREHFFTSKNSAVSGNRTSGMAAACHDDNQDNL